MTGEIQTLCIWSGFHGKDAEWVKKRVESRYPGAKVDDAALRKCLLEGQRLKRMGGIRCGGGSCPVCNPFHR